MKKKHILSLLCVGLSAFTVTAFADDTIRFSIGAISTTYPAPDTLQVNTGSITNVGGATVSANNPNNLEVTLTFQRIYENKSSSVPKGSQTQSGPFNLSCVDGSVCSGSWTHEFYIDNNGLHDRFWVNGCGSKYDSEGSAKSQDQSVAYVYCGGH